MVLDLGSKVWKVGYSGEPAPRVCYPIGASTGSGSSSHTPPGGEGPLWGLSKEYEGEQKWKIKMERLKRALRHVWFK